MRVLLEIALQDYYLCLVRIPLNSSEYRMLMNGIRDRNDKGEEVIHILCEAPRAQAIRNAIATHCPEAAGRVKELPVNDNS
jgi:hypothetical protein